jgi:hypothetical protein
MRISLVFILMLTLGIPAWANKARVCSPQFSAERVFHRHDTSTLQTLLDSLRNSCEENLSTSQIAGKVLKTCLKTCEGSNKSARRLEENAENFNSKCRNDCLATVQTMAKENQRLKTASKP